MVHSLGSVRLDLMTLKVFHNLNDSMNNMNDKIAVLTVLNTWSASLSNSRQVLVTESCAKEQKKSLYSWEVRALQIYHVNPSLHTQLSKGWQLLQSRDRGHQGRDAQIILGIALIPRYQHIRNQI